MNHSVHMKGRMRLFLAAISLLCLSVSSMAQTKWSEVLWCESNSTLYFVQRENNTMTPGKWSGLDVERLAVSNSVDNTGTDKPYWIDKVGKKVKRVVFDSSFANSAPFSTAYWFYGMSALEEIIGMNYLKTYRTTTMRCMFNGCSSLKSINLSYIDTSNVTDMFCMFFLTGKLTSIDLSKFNTSNVTNMASMFSNTGLTSIDVSNFDTSKVTDMDGMFANYKGASLDVRNFDTRNVRRMSSMFSHCTKITTLDISSFYNKLTNTDYMFYDCPNLTTIYTNSTWAASSSTGMFEDCTSLKGAISYSPDKTDVTYANPNTGYFTFKTLRMKINNKEVSRDDVNDLTVMSGVSVAEGGYAKYDIDNSTLSLKDATIYGWSPFESEIKELTINIEGKNYITTSSEESGNAMMLYNRVTITGGGYLYTSGGGNGAGIQINGFLTVENATVEAYGKYGIRGLLTTSPQTGALIGSGLTLCGNRSKVIANSNNKWNDAGASIGNFSSITLKDGASVTSPYRAKVLDGNIVDADGNTIIAQEVVLSSPVTNYDFKINGEPVTDWNCDDLTVIDGVELAQPYGFAKYDPSTQTLHLNNVNIKSTGVTECISTFHSYLDYITVEGVVRIEADRGSAIWHGFNTTINGGGFLMLQSNSTGATMYTGGVLTLDNVYVNIYGSSWGLSGQTFIRSDGSEIPIGSLVMQNNAILSAVGTEVSIRNLTNITLKDGIVIRDPEGAAWDSSKLSVCVNGKECSGRVDIAVPEEKLDLWIAGTQLTTVNAPYIGLVLGTDIYRPLQTSKDYKIAYDQKTKTLHMDNVSISTTTNAALISRIDGLTISVENNPCYLITTNSNCNGITLYGNTTIQSVNVTPTLATLGFSLFVSASTLTGIEYYGTTNGTVTLKDIRMFVSGGDYGITGRSYKDNYYATLSITGKDTYLLCNAKEGSIFIFKALKLDSGLQIHIPDYGTFSNHGVRNSDGELATGVLIYSKAGKKGDVNQDGKVDISDIVAVINTIAGDTTYKSTADVNEDTNIDISDIVAIINIIAGQ